MSGKVIAPSIEPRLRFFDLQAELQQGLRASPNNIDVFGSTNRSFSTPEKPLPLPRLSTRTLFASSTFRIGIPKIGDAGSCGRQD